MRVLGGAFHAIAKEMSGVLFRMSYSSIIRESEDLGAGIFDAQGRELCESDSTPMHIGSLPWYIRGFMRHLEGNIVEGDVIIHNHPYYGASHSPDIAVAVPIFCEERARRLRGRDGARARRRRLVPGDQRRRVRRLRRGQDLRRAALVPGRRAERGPRQDDLRQRPHGDDEPRRHERDDGRLPARARPDAAALPALRRGHRDERRVRLDGLLRGDAARADPCAAGRGVQGADGLARRRRAEPRRAAARRDEGDRRRATRSRST